MQFPFGSSVLDAASRLLTPFIMLFAVYVLVHGHLSPGGGFQGGAILAAALILVKLNRGRNVQWGLSRVQALRLSCIGLFVYTAIGLTSLLFGGNFLDYGKLPLPMEGPHLRAVGTLGIETGVLMGVTGVLTLIFDSLIAWSEEE
ncbi:MAG: MnhB domain-containing protein [Acidobacteriota bacterium]